MAFDVDVVFDGDGEAAEGLSEVGGFGFLEGGVEIPGEVGAEHGVAGFDGAGDVTDEVGGGDFFGGELLAELGEGKGGEGHGVRGS